jgi:hypothetical protein
MEPTCVVVGRYAGCWLFVVERARVTGGFRFVSKACRPISDRVVYRVKRIAQHGSVEQTVVVEGCLTGVNVSDVCLGSRKLRHS